MASLNCISILAAAAILYKPVSQAEVEEGGKASPLGASRSHNTKR